MPIVAECDTKTSRIRTGQKSTEIRGILIHDQWKYSEIDTRSKVGSANERITDLIGS